MKKTTIPPNHIRYYFHTERKTLFIVSSAGLLYNVSLLLIVYFGSRNVLQEGWVSWNIAAFTTFLTCFTKLAVRSATVAKLLNAVQKADVRSSSALLLKALCLFRKAYRKGNLIRPQVFGRDRSVIGGGQHPSHGKSDSIAAILLRPGRVGSVEAVKQLLRRNLRQLFTGILDLHQNPLVPLFQKELHGAAFFRVLYSIVQ